MNPLSAIFAAGVSIRNSLYDRGVFKVNRLALPVVSVGNISVGGSGKTPFVIALGQLLKERGITFDVLTRGYGRRGTDVAIVDPNGRPEQFGDEPLLIASKLGVPVIVAADRYAAGVLAEKQFASQLHLLDDGFQHRRLHRDFDIVVVPDSDFADTPLPIGRLREPLTALARADAVALPGQAQWNHEKILVWRAQRQMLLPPNHGKVIAFCGIGRPEQFFSGLRDLGIEIGEPVSFPDHHRYTEQDVTRLLDIKSRSEANGFITTEKDAINLGAFAERLQPLRTAQLVLSVEDPSLALSTLLGTLERRSGCRF